MLGRPLRSRRPASALGALLAVSLSALAAAGCGADNGKLITVTQIVSETPPTATPDEQIESRAHLSLCAPRGYGVGWQGFSAAGDVNGDAVPDVLVGVARNGLQAASRFGGEVEVVFGSRQRGRVNLLSLGARGVRITDTREQITSAMTPLHLELPLPGARRPAPAIAIATRAGPFGHVYVLAGLRRAGTIDLGRPETARSLGVRVIRIDGRQRNDGFGAALAATNQHLVVGAPGGRPARWPVGKASPGAIEFIRRAYLQALPVASVVAIVLGDAQQGYRVPGRVTETSLGYRVVAAGDANGDGVGDVAAAVSPAAGRHDDGVRVLLGDLPQYRRHSSYLVAGHGVQVGPAVSAGDLTGDGLDDLALASFTRAAGAIAPGQRQHGTIDFATLIAGPHALPGSPSRTIAALGDVDGDGQPDLAVTESGGGEKPAVLLGAKRYYPFESASFQGSEVRALGDDMNGDGRPDLLVSHAYGKIVLGRACVYVVSSVPAARRAPTIGQRYPVPGTVESLIAANSDLDIVAATSHPGTSRVYFISAVQPGLQDPGLTVPDLSEIAFAGPYGWNVRSVATVGRPTADPKPVPPSPKTIAKPEPRSAPPRPSTATGVSGRNRGGRVVVVGATFPHLRSTIVRIEARDGREVRFDAGDDARFAGFADGALWIAADRNERTQLTRIDERKGARTQTTIARSSDVLVTASRIATESTKDGTVVVRLLDLASRRPVGEPITIERHSSAYTVLSSRLQTRLRSAATLTATARTLVVRGAGGRDLLLVDLRTGARIAAVHRTLGERSTIVAGGTSVWEIAGRQVVRLDPRTGRRIGSLLLPAAAGLVAADDHGVWIAIPNDHSILRIDAPVRG